MELQHIKPKKGETISKMFKAEGNYGKMEVAIICMPDGRYEVRRWVKQNKANTAFVSDYGNTDNYFYASKCMIAEIKNWEEVIF